ncbi:MAG: TonB family protein [Bacteroidales bacterium]|nr:TonB family protein [Bacteroidales bacterium]
MKTVHFFFALMLATAASVCLSAQEVRDTVIITDMYDYVGQWPEGSGSYYSYDKGLIIGNFVKGVPQGPCVAYLSNGENYCGEYKDGERTGYGCIYRDEYGVVMVGGFLDGRPHGIDTLHRRDGSVLIGEFRKGKLKKKIIEYSRPPQYLASRRPVFPEMSLTPQQQNFLYDLRVYWETGGDMDMASLVKPKFLGGDINDFVHWVDSQLSIPLTPSGNPLYGTVIVQFTVTKEGEVADVHAIHGTEHILNEAAVTAVSRSPKWEPGSYNGANRGVRMTIPVTFEQP